mmetsp:Transcript_1752/g.4395  ORF Transcript_1752/g.4395 Transcript_1752/m.4395 type:complete len:173 (+) Transcript_1752:118-636(+)
MHRQALSLASVAAAISGGSARLLIGDVMSESEGLRGSPSQQQQQQQNDRRSLTENVDILEAMLGKEHFDIERDECLQETVNGTAVYSRCDIRHFPYCTGDRANICFNRINRQDAFWPDKHPKYYIDYNRVHCYPDRANGVDFTCSSCSPGRWCMPEGRCILDENLYHCWSDE